MTNRTSVNKILSGIQRYGLLRAINGSTAFLKCKLLRPKTGITSTITDGLIVHFQYPTQFLPTLILFRELVEPEYEFLRQSLTKDSTFFDVGGGIGTYSVFVARLTSGPIHTFEPVEENITTINCNLHANSVDSRVRLNRIALSNKEGFGHMKKDAHLFCSRLSDVSMQSYDDSIRVTTLDAYCLEEKVDHIDVLKIDVEGHEREVIEGARGLLRDKKIDVIILEVYSELDDFYDSLKYLGFNYFYYDYSRNSLKRIAPIRKDNIERLKPSPFHSNVILIRRGLGDRHRRLKKLADARRH
jgi:FkbM family methyltransferase